MDRHREHLGLFISLPLGLSHLVDGYIVARLLEARRVVVPIPHHDADLVQNHSANKFIGTLYLNHNGSDVVGGLKEREREKEGERWSIKQIV